MESYEGWGVSGRGIERARDWKRGVLGRVRIHSLREYIFTLRGTHGPGPPIVRCGDANAVVV